jgi:hypothetical protein
MASEPEADALYGLPLERFTSARDALAARLRSSGDVEEAASVKALRKPTTPAWAVNQVARRAREQVEELIAASDRLRRAQQALLEGGPAHEVWEATLVEREAIRSLTDEAERALVEAGSAASRSTLDRVADTLAAAAADVGGRTLLRRGILTAEMRRAGFGEILSDAPAAAPAKKKEPEPAGAKGRPLLEAERESTRLARAADRAEEDAERFARAAAKADDEVSSAERRLVIAQKEASAAKAEATAARKAANAARRQADKAAAVLDKLRAATTRSR